MENNNYKYVVKACFQHKFKLIYLNEISVEGFLDQCAKIFKFSYDKALIKLTDRDGATIHAQHFPNVVENFSSCGYFCIHLIIEGMDGILVVTPNDFQEYLISVGATSLLDAIRTQITVKQRQELIRYSFDFLDLRCKKPFTVDQKQALANAAISLFPCLKSSGNNGGTDIFMGFLNKKVTNVKFAAKRKSNGAECSVVGNESMSESHVIADIVAERQRLDVEDLKSKCVTSDMSEIKEKLKSTLSFRSKMLENKSLDLKENFPYFFTNPEMILYDFSLRYKDIDCGAFIDSWSAYRVRLNDILTNQYQKKCHTIWPQEIQDLLVLLKLVPAKSNGRNLLSIQAFNKAIGKLFVFRKAGVAIQNLIDSKNNYPYIIACGESEQKITHFYIEVEKEILNVPDTFTAVETFDLFFKVHKIFNLDFDPNLKPMMKFIQHFIFRIDSKRPYVTTRMKDLFNSLSNPPEP